MLFPSIEPTINYKLCGESLETAYEIHEQHKAITQEYAELEAKVREYSESLMGPFNQKHVMNLSNLLRKLAGQLGIPFEEITQYHLDASYLEDHGIAFLKQSVGNRYHTEYDDEFPGDGG